MVDKIRWCAFCAKIFQQKGFCYSEGWLTKGQHIYVY